jgi:hypothetical protein
MEERHYPRRKLVFHSPASLFMPWVTLCFALSPFRTRGVPLSGQELRGRVAGNYPRMNHRAPLYTAPQTSPQVLVKCGPTGASNSYTVFINTVPNTLPTNLFPHSYHVSVELLAAVTCLTSAAYWPRFNQSGDSGVSVRLCEPPHSVQGSSWNGIRKDESEKEIIKKISRRITREEKEG